MWHPIDDIDGSPIYPRGNRSLMAYTEQHGVMSAADATYIFAQLLDAMNYLFHEGISHCDIKPENITVDDQLNVSSKPLRIHTTKHKLTTIYFFFDR